MSLYADTSFLARLYTPHADSERAIRLMARLADPLSFTPLHRHELRNALRLLSFRGEITDGQLRQAFEDIEMDLGENILAHVPVPWTETFRQAEKLGAFYTQKLGVRSFDLLHVGLALVLDSSEFFTFDHRQAALAKAAGLNVKP